MVGVHHRYRHTGRIRRAAQHLRLGTPQMASAVAIGIAPGVHRPPETLVEGSHVRMSMVHLPAVNTPQFD